MDFSPMNKWLLALLLVLPLTVSAQHRVIQREGKTLAHSLSFDPEVLSDDMPVALRQLLSGYKTRTHRYAPRMQGRAVAPLLQSIRHQDYPYNISCPYYINDDGTQSEKRCITGCVATCIEQVLNYYKHPQALQDTLHGWSTAHYTIPDVLPGTPIDWPNVLNDYSGDYTEAQAQAEADLVYYCGVAVHMNWGVRSSGANLHRAFDPLWSAFDYKTVAFVQRAFYSNDAWNRLLRNELENGRPICYTGHNMALSGHAFNIDGVDEQGFYHLNWGYGGQYDGYFDLDYLNPFEPCYDETELGRMEGFLSNQTALFMHPEDFEIDIYDTLSIDAALHGVRVDDVKLRRPADTQRYTVLDFTFTNTTQDTLNYTFEVLTYLPTDTAIFEQADYIGISAVNLLPGEQRVWPVYCQFAEPGDRILAISADDETLLVNKPVHVDRGTRAVLEFGEFSRQDVRLGDNLTSVFSIPVTNTASAGWAGDLLTFSLRPFDQEDEIQHWQVLQLPAGESIVCQLTYQHLVDGKAYEIFVRDAYWKVRSRMSFIYHADEAVDEIQSPQLDDQSARYYDIQGRRVLNPVRGLYIKNGKKIWIP